MLQEQLEGTRLPVGYWSHGLSHAEKNDFTTEHKCLGVVWSLLKLRHVLDGHRFLIWTERQALSYIYSSTDSSGRLMQWSLRLSAYTFEMQYKPGASHHAIDFLSRTVSNAAFEDINDDILCHALAETANGLPSGRYTSTNIPALVKYDDIVEVQQTDEFCFELAKSVARTTAKALFQIESHGLCKRAPYGDKFVIPESLLECKTSGLSRHVEPYFQHFTHFKHHFPRGTLPP